MGCGNQPAFTPFEEGKDEFNLANRPSGDEGGGWSHGAYNFEDDIMSFPSMSQGYDQLPGSVVQGDCYSYTPNLNCKPDPKIDRNWSDIKNYASEYFPEYEMPSPGLSLRGHGSDRLMSPAVTSMDYGQSLIPMNFITSPRCEPGTGYPIKTHGAEAQSSRINRFQSSRQFSSSKSGTSLLPLVDNFGAKGNKNDINSFALTSSAPQKIDRDFLTLGVGGSIEVRPNRNFSSQEISNNLQAISSQGNNPIVGQFPKNSSSLAQLAGVDARIRTNAGGSSRPDNNFRSRILTGKLEEVSSQFNNSSPGNCPKNPISLRELSGGDSGIQTNVHGLSISNRTFHAQEIPSKLKEVSFQCNTSMAGDFPKDSSNLTQLAGGAAIIQTNASGLSRPACSSASKMPTHVEGGLSGDTRFRLNSIAYPGLQTMQASVLSNTPPDYTTIPEPTQLPWPSGSTLFSQPKYGSQPKLASTYFATHPISQKHDFSRKSSMKVSSESSRDYLSHWHNRSPIGNVRAGDLISAAEGTRTEIANIGSLPSSVQPVGQFDGFHNVSPIEASRHISQVRIGVPFSRSGSYQSAAAGCFPKRLGLQPNDFATAQFARGQYQHVMPAQPSAVFPRFDHSNGLAAPFAKFDVRPQLAPVISHPKRKAVANPSAVSGQRRKIFPQPGTNDYATRRRPSIPPHMQTAFHTPPATLHIKSKGSEEEEVKPIGERCFLCKLDLAFTAERGMHQPAGPPPVAILPCGHMFHDQCLQVITPEDQLKNPPCIPCATGET